MREFEIIETIAFEKEFNKIPKDIKERFETQIKKLKSNPFAQGKQLGYKWFRELKNKGYRIYYLVYEKEVVVLFVGVSDKKEQQAMIDFIIKNLKVFKDLIKK